MVCVITGAGGFVGSYLARELHGTGENNVVLYGVTNEEVSPQLEPYFEDIADIDICNYDDLRGFFKLTKPDLIYHLAAQSSVAVSFEQPVETFKVNVGGTINVIEAALNELNNSPKLLLVASGDVYKSPSHGAPLTEESPLEPLNPYAASKAAVDYLANVYWKNNGLNVIWTRSFNHIGPEQSTNFVMPSFAQQIAGIEAGLRKPVLKVGNLNVSRDFTDVRDVVKAYTMLMDNGRPGEVYNVCSNIAYSIQEMLDQLLDLAECSIKVSLDPARMRPGDNPVLYGDNTKLKNHTGWKPSIPISQTLEDLLNYWRKKVKEDTH